MSNIKTTTLFTLELEGDTFNAEVLKAKKTIAELTGEKDKLLQKQKQNIELTDEEIITLTKLDGAIAANKKEVRDLTSIIQKKTEADIAQKGSQKEMMALYSAAEKELKRLGGTFERTAKGELVLTNANKQNTVATNEIFQKLKEYDSLLGKHNLNVGNYGGVLTGLKQKIVELDQQRSIATDPEEVMKLTSEIRKLTLQQDQYLGKVDALGQRVAKNDIKDGFQDANGAAMALSGSLGLLSLAMGTDSKAGETLRKVMIGVTIAQTALTIAQSKADIQGTLNIIKTKALTAAQWAYNNAIKAFGITGLLVGLAIVVSRIINARKETDKAAKSQKEYNDELKAAQDTYDESIDGLTEANKGLERNLRLREAQGASEEELLRLRREILYDQIKGIDGLVNENASMGKRLELEERRKDLWAEMDILDIEYNKNQKERLENENKTTDALRAQVTELNILTVAEKEKLNAQLNETFLASPNIQKAFQNLLGVDDETFKQAWSQIGTTIDNSSQGLKGVAENQKYINGLLDEELQKRIALAEKQEEMKDRALVFSEIMGTAFTGLFQNAEQQQKEFFKNSLIMLLNYFENYFREKLGEMALNQIAQYGVVLGTVRTAIVGAGMFAAFELAKQKISGFAEGGLITPEQGLPITRDNGDNRLATVKTGEVILNEPQQQGLKQLAGVDVFRKLRIPGFVGGGLVLGDGGFASRSTVSQITNSFEIKQAVVEAMRLMPPSIVHVTEINRVQGNVNSVKVNASLNG